MNTIIKGGETHDFTTRDELFAVSRKIIGAEITHIYRDGLRLFGYDTTPVMYEIGTSRELVPFLGGSPL